MYSRMGGVKQFVEDKSVRAAGAAVATNLRSIRTRSCTLSAAASPSRRSSGGEGDGEAAHSLRGSDEGRKATQFVDRKLHFRVRKPKSATLCEQPSEIPCEGSGIASARFSTRPDDVASTEPATMVEDSGMESRPRRKLSSKRNAETESEGSPVRRSKSRGASKTRIIVSASERPIGAKAPATSGVAVQISSADFWHSSLSENAGGPEAENAMTAAAPALVPSKSLRAVEDIAAGIEHLKSADVQLRTIIEMHDAPTFGKSTSAFASLARSIVFQQLATKAASTIFGRVVDLCGGLDNLQPAKVSELTVQQLRAVGISERKASYLHDLAANFSSGALSDSTIYTMDDEALMRALIAVKGIGVWSVHMFMIFTLHKADVLPVGDLGVRKGFQKLYRLHSLPTATEMEKLASSWKPYRSLGSWYMWRVTEINLPF